MNRPAPDELDDLAEIDDAEVDEMSPSEGFPAIQGARNLAVPSHMAARMAAFLRGSL